MINICLLSLFLLSLHWLIKIALDMKATIQTLDFDANRVTNHRGIIDDVYSWIESKIDFLISVHHFEPTDFTVENLPGAVYLYCYRPRRPKCRKVMNFAFVLTFV